jgi:hypothetical protein
MNTTTNVLHRCSRLLVLGVLCTACGGPWNQDLPIEPTSEASGTTTETVSDDADDTMEGSTSIGTTEADTTEAGTTGPDGCPPAVFDASRFDEACFQ